MNDERIILDSEEWMILRDLERIAAELRIEVRYESLADEELSIHSGGCKALGRHIILIDSAQPTRQRASILARELSRFDLEDIYVLPRVRDFISRQREPREKSRSQR